jgi:hypothetical protein
MARWAPPFFGRVSGSGVIVSEVREVRDFDEVELSGSGVVTITQTGEESLSIEADDNILSLLRTEVHGRRLELGMVSGANIKATRPVRYTLTVRQLHGVSVSGSGRLQVSGLTTDGWQAHISGSGDVVVTGQTPQQELSISGSGSYFANEFASGVARVHISGSGSASIQVHERLEVHVSGSGSLRYTGQPQVSKSISGSGSVRPHGASVWGKHGKA